MILKRVFDLAVESDPLELVEMPIPAPAENEILIKVSCCGVCHTELDEIEGRTAPPAYPIVPGHQVVGFVERTGASAKRFQPGERAGVAWIFSACGECDYCRTSFRAVD